VVTEFLTFHLMSLLYNQRNISTYMLPYSLHTHST